MKRGKSVWFRWLGLFLVLVFLSGFSACKRPDNDGMDDAWEKQYGLDPKNPEDALWDKDSDGLSNLEEFKLGTNPTLADTDSDGKNDSAEINAKTSPTNPDTDGDGDKDGSDCMPLNPSINHNQKEGPIGDPTCVDTFDNDCDGLIDQGDPDCACKEDADCKSPNSCQQAVCEQGVCNFKPVADGTACDDGNCCTEKDKCKAGACAGTEKVCPKNKVCDISSCQCSEQPK